MKGRKHITRFTIVMVMAVLAVGVFAGAALATDASPAAVGGTLTLGPLQIDSITAVTFGSEALTGRAKTFTATGASGTFIVTDATGSGAGYHIQATRSALTAGGHTLDGTFAMPAAVVTTVDSGSSTTGPVPAAQGSMTAGTAYTIASAAVNTGMGSYNLTFGADDHKLTMGITADDYVGIYSGTLTISTVSGP